MIANIGKLPPLSFPTTVGCSRPHSVKADCTVVQIAARKLGESPVSSCPDHSPGRTLTILCSRLWQRPMMCHFPKPTAAVHIDISRFTQPQSAAILVKVGCRNPHSATADCSAAQIRGWELAESRMSIHATYPLQRTLAIHCSRLWKLTMAVYCL